MFQDAANVLLAGTVSVINMTVQELIEQLSEIKDKSREVLVEYHDDIQYNYVAIDGHYNTEHECILSSTPVY